MTKRLHNKRTLKGFRKDLRNNLTKEEAILWNHLKKRKLSGYKFRRQHSIGNYILDFYCPEAKLGVELDGMHHFTEKGEMRDIKRDEFLQMQGVVVLRIENSGIRDNLSSVLDWIQGECESRKVT